MRHPLYDVTKTFKENIKEGPFFNGEIPERIMPPKILWSDILGYQVATPIGVAACSVMTSKGIALLSKLGFDILTYKSVRTKAVAPYDMPNITYVTSIKQLQQHDIDQQICAVHHPPYSIADLTLANSFGNACLEPHWMQQDIQKARNSISEGQILMVSVYGNGKNMQEIAADFARAAQMVVDAGAQVVEVNVSCPNIIDDERNTYYDADLTQTVVEEVVKTVGRIPVTVKLSTFPSKSSLRQTMLAIARAGAQGICGINTVSMRVIDESGHPVFGDKRAMCGVSGYAIRNLALQFVKDVHDIDEELDLDLTILGTGGVMEAHHFREFLQVGADVAMSATGTMWNPYLAHEYHQFTMQQSIATEKIKEL